LKQATFSSSNIRFGPFEANLRTEELLREGIRIKLPQQSFRLLALLLERPGELVTREEIQTRLWRDGTVVEFENGINAAVRRLRRALHDSAEKPRYVETLARLGYRFIAVPMEVADARSHSQAKPNGIAKVPAAPVVAPLATVTEIGTRDHALAPFPKREPAERLPFVLPQPRRVGRRAKLTAATVALVAVALTILAVVSRPPSGIVMRTTQITRSGRIQVDTPITSDGRRLYLVERIGGHFQLDSVNMEGGPLQPVSTPFSDTQLFGISPDGTQLLLGNLEGMPDETPLWLVPVMDGSPRRLGDITAHAAAFSRDGRRLAFANGSTLYVANADGSEVRSLVSVDGTPREMSWSPDGGFLRFNLEGPPGRSSLWEISIESGATRQLLAGWRGARTRWADGESGGDWVQNGKYFIFRSARNDVAGIWAMREGSWLPWRERPFQIYQGPLYLLQMLAVEDGTRVYFSGDDQHYELMRYDTGSRTFMPYLGGVSAEAVSYSRDGNWVAYITLPDRILWKSRVDGSQRQQLTFAPALAAFPEWSPDGNQIAFELTQEGTQKIALIPSSGGTPRILLPGRAEEFGPSWEPDGNSLLLFRRHGGVSSIYSLNLKSRELVSLPESSGFKGPKVSPDGQYVIAGSDDDRKVVLFDVHKRMWTQLASTTTVHGTFWAKDSRSIYYQDAFGSSQQPIYKIDILTRKMEKVADTSNFLRSDVRNYSFTGLAPDDSCIVRLTRANSDVYAVDFKLD
jgi:Tol biopolymer transport system component/DNA-binding winged helix-turn-helix (wHTH) protein